MKNPLKEFQIKRISTLFLVFLCYFNMNAQDTIKLKNDKEVNVSIVNDSKDDIGTIHSVNRTIDTLILESPRSKFPLGIYGGVSLIENEFRMFTCIDYMLTPNLSAEINLGSFVKRFGLNYYYSLGGKYWFANKYSKSGFSPYVGLLYSGASFLIDGGVDRVNFIEVPAGISYITKFGFQTSLQFSCLTDFNYILGPNIELRVGWRFK
jgi:hypothetical protein